MWNESVGQIANVLPTSPVFMSLPQSILGITLSLTPGRMYPIFMHIVMTKKKLMLMNR